MSKLAWQARYELKEQLHNLKVLPKQREPGWSVKKPESQGIGGRDKPGEQRGQADRGAKPEPIQPNPAEQQDRERRGKPPPEGVGEQPSQKATEPKASRPLLPSIPEEEVVETLSPEVEEAIRAYAMGDPEEEAQLREQAKNDPDLRRELLHPGGSLAYFTPPIPHRVFGSEDKSS